MTDPSRSAGERLADRLSWLALVALTIVAAFTFAGYGIGADEWNTSRYGQTSLDWYLTWGADRSSFGYFDLHYYGAWIHALIALIERLVPAAPMAVRHGVGMGLGLVCLAGTWRLGRRLGGPWAGFAALLVLALTPYFWGQMAFLPVDTPFAAAMTWALLAGLRYAGELPRPRFGSVLLVAVVAGLAAGVRIGAIPILFVDVCVAVAAFAWARRLSPGALVGPMAWQVPVAGVIVWAVMLACWPWAAASPIANPLETLNHFGKLPINFEFPFWGNRVRTTDLPWTYVPGFLLAKLPLLFIAALLATPLAAWMALRAPETRREFAPTLAVIACAAFMPVAVAILTHATLYDGVRHFQFILAPLAALAGFSLVRLAGSGRVMRGVIIVLGGATAISSVIVEAQLYPYEYIWFNELGGGVRGSVGRFEQDYWASAESEAVARLREILRKEGTESQPYRYKLCVWWNDISPLVPSNWVKVEGDAPRDFLIAVQRFPCPPGDIQAGVDQRIVQIERDGVPLAWVWDRRAGR